MARLAWFPSLSLTLTLSLLAACGDDESTITPDAATPAPDAGAADAPGADAGDEPAVYEFESRFTPGTSSVVYGGQAFRQVLISDLGAYIAGLTGPIDSGDAPADGEVLAGLLFYYQYDGTTSGEVPILLATDPPALQTTYAELGNANLKGKLAGNDNDANHVDWSTGFAGWAEGGATSPDALVQYWFGLLDDAAFQRGLGTIPLAPDGTAITKVYITAKGQDLRQLIQKFFHGALAFSQASDDYLDSATAGKGVRSANTQDGDKPFTVLEHAWDEAFGYFGAARDYARFTDEEIAAVGGRDAYQRGYHDANGDGKIDLASEINLGSAATNAAKRDLGSDASAATDFSGAIIDAFVRGRALIASVDGELSPAQLAQLEAERDIIVASWEMTLAASAVHYINAVLRDMATFDTAGYSFEDHAKHWSELKGFALGLQFNPIKTLGTAQFAELHTRLGDAPVLPSALPAAITQYRADLLAARDILATAYGFDAANVGDASGENGW